MLDFDALNPSQKRLASNLLYLYPFIYASVKWPLMYAREYPARAAFIGQGAVQEHRDVPQAIANLWLKHGIDFSSANPLSPIGDIAESTQQFLKDPSKMDLTVLQERLSPTLAALAQGLSGGKKNAAANLVRTTIPGVSEVMSADPRFRGGKQFGDQSREAYLLQRHLRFYPRGVNPEVIKERIDKFHQDRATGSTHAMHMAADKAKINGYVKKLGGYDAEDTKLIQDSYHAWWHYQEAVDRKKQDSGQRKLSEVQQAEILTATIQEYFPDRASELYPMDQIRQAKDMSTVAAYNTWMKGVINEGRQLVFDDYRSEAAP